MFLHISSICTDFFLKKKSRFQFCFLFWLIFSSNSILVICFHAGCPGGPDGKESACNAGDPGSIPGSGRFPGERNVNPLQSSCPENPMERGSLVGYRPWGCKESGMTEWQTLSFSVCIHNNKYSLITSCQGQEVPVKFHHPPLLALEMKMKVKVKSLSRVRLFATPWTVAYQAPLFMGFSRQEHWSGLPFPSPGDLPNPGIEPRSPTL